MRIFFLSKTGPLLLKDNKASQCWNEDVQEGLWQTVQVDRFKESIQFSVWRHKLVPSEASCVCGFGVVSSLPRPAARNDDAHPVWSVLFNSPLHYSGSLCNLNQPHLLSSYSSGPFSTFHKNTWCITGPQHSPQRCFNILNWNNKIKERKLSSWHHSGPNGLCPSP